LTKREGEEKIKKKKKKKKESELLGLEKVSQLGWS
jgi:hypothetical protein